MLAMANLPNDDNWRGQRPCFGVPLGCPSLQFACEFRGKWPPFFLASKRKWLLKQQPNMTPNGNKTQSLRDSESLSTQIERLRSLGQGEIVQPPELTSEAEWPWKKAGELSGTTRLSKPIGSHFGLGAQILEPILVGVGMFTGGTILILTHGHQEVGGQVPPSKVKPPFLELDPLGDSMSGVGDLSTSIHRVQLLIWLRVRKTSNRIVS